MKNLEWETEFSPSYTILKVKINPGEELTAEPGAMVLTRGSVKVKTGMKGGLLKGLGRKLLGGESVFMNTYIAEHDSGEIWLAPSLPGDIKYIKLENSEFHVQDMAYLAHHGDIEVGIKFKGFKGLLGGGEVFWLKLSGTGGVWISSYGGLSEINLDPGEKIVVDNFHALAIESTVNWSVKKFGGMKTFLLGGEGLVVEAKGPGRVYVQTRIIPELVRVIQKFLPKSR
ncbi:MAG: TIGR00266 family protein [Candidatus Njordarchaeia archaeon]